MSRSTTIIVDQEEHDVDVSFISRWSKLKHETNQKTIKLATKKTAETGAPDEQQASSKKILTDKDMPDIETMTADSNYADFFSSGVSDGLRKLALRKLFHNEEFNICDGLDEYDGDYTQFEKLGSLVTADMQHQIELLAQREAEKLCADDAIDEIAVDDHRSNLADDKAEIEVAVTNKNLKNPEPT